MRIAIAGLSIESSRFSLDVADADYFVQKRGQALLDSYEWPTRLGSLVDGVEWFPVLSGLAPAAGPVAAEAYDRLEAEILEGLGAGLPYDGVYLDMHGAMSVVGRDDAEEHFVRRVRELVGPDTVISLSMDPHGNMSEELAGYVDLAACHRHAPHIDTWQTRERAVALLIETIRSGSKPLKAWVRVPQLFPGERTSTVVEPAKSVFGALVPTIEKYGVVDANLWIGFAWADEPRCSGAVLVTGYDEKAIHDCAEEIARSYWDERAGFQIVSNHHGSWDEALDFVLGRPARPTFVSDSGDNVTAGGSGDLTFALTRTRDRADLRDAPIEFLFAGIVDRVAVDAAVNVGVGARLDHAIGAGVDDRFAGPVREDWLVESFVEGINGEGIVAAVLRSGRISVSVQSRRALFTPPEDSTLAKRIIPGLAWFDVAPYDVVVVKNGYLFPGQAAIAGSAFMAITPGGTDLDMDRLQFTRIVRPMYPFDLHFDAQFSVVTVPSASR